MYISLTCIMSRNLLKNVLNTTSCGPYKPDPGASEQGTIIKATEEMHDTIGMIAIDAEGKIAAGTSSNGMRHKVKGYV